MNKNVKKIAATAAAACLLAGCGSYMKKYESKIVEMPPEDAFEQVEGVEYPQFQKYTYFSSTAGRDTNVNVLLPAGYDESKEYPVLYILHGYWDN